MVLQSQQKYDDAAALYREALASTETRVVGDTRSVLLLVGNLAKVLHKKGVMVAGAGGAGAGGAGALSEAEFHYRRALAGLDRSADFGPRHPRTLALLRNLAAVYRQQGKFIEARDLVLRARAQAKKIPEPGPCRSPKLRVPVLTPAVAPVFHMHPLQVPVLAPYGQWGTTGRAHSHAGCGP